MIESLIEKIFNLRNAAHAAHWKTNSYSEHKALGKYYEDVIGGLDEVIESYQGVFGIVGKLESGADNIKKEIEDQIVWMNENRNEIAKNIPAIENLLDNLVAVHMKTLYKLENLR
jgi:uncharacterized protein Yka (UPF0111/DUF47 family)